MKGTVVTLVSGEALADGHGSTIIDQRKNAKELADGLTSVLQANVNLSVLHGNKPQVGFVLFRSEVASHALHTVPLDVCGADTQGATGYMIAQAIRNKLLQYKIEREVICILTQTVVDTDTPDSSPLKAIGPWFDREKAEQYRQTRKWDIIEEPGRGYRRGVHSFPPRKILEMNVIKDMVEEGKIVIAGGGGGIPVFYNNDGILEGIEAVIDTEKVACMIAHNLNANILLIVIDSDEKFIRSGIMMDGFITLSELDNIIDDQQILSNTVLGTLKAASEFLHRGGEQVMITNLLKLHQNLINKKGLRIGVRNPSIDLFRL